MRLQPRDPALTRQVTAGLVGRWQAGAMRFLIAGASGFLGSHLRESLALAGHDVTALVRRPAGAGEARWDPYAGMLDPDLVARADVVVNLAGSPTAGNPHS